MDRQAFLETKRIRILSASIVTAMAFFSVVGCAPKKPAPIPPTAVVAATPLHRRLVDWDDYIGQFLAVDSVDVRPRVSGYLQSVGFNDGQVVHKGQILFRIDPRPYQAALDQAKGQVDRARAALDNAHAEVARGTTLLGARAISQQAFDLLAATERQDAADLVSAQATVATAALNLDFTRVTAPLSGRISDRRIAPGNLVTADTTILTNIVNLDPIRFLFTGSESLYLKYLRENAAGTRRSSRQVANPVEIRLQDEPTYRWKGRMDFVDNVVDAGSGTIRGRAVVDNPNFFLTPGMFGHMRLEGSGAYDALLVPDRAIVTDQSRQVVFVVDSQGKIAQKVVTLGPLFQGMRVVRAGVSANDRVIIDGVLRLKAGQVVKVHPGKIEPDKDQGVLTTAGNLTPLPTSATEDAADVGGDR